MGREKINRWYIGFKKVTMHVKKKNTGEKKKTAWEKKIHSNIFYVLHNKEFKNKSSVVIFLKAAPLGLSRAIACVRAQIRVPRCPRTLK